MDVLWLEPPPHSAYHNPFRSNIQQFLRQYGTKVQLSGLTKVSAWIVPLYGPPDHPPVLLHVYEDKLVDSKPAICDQCRNMGE